MLSEKDTPLPLVREWAELIPGVWDKHAALTEEIRHGESEEDAAEPELIAALDIIQEITPPGESSEIEMAHAAFDLCCCAVWRRNKIIYAFDSTLAAELIAQADDWTDASALPIEVLAHPPYRCCFIAAPGAISPDFIGFFPVVVHGLSDVSQMLALCAVYHAGSELAVHVELLHLTGKTVGECVEHTLQAARAAAAKIGQKPGIDKRTVLRLINLYLYVCAANADTDDTPPPTYRPRKEGAPIRDKFREVKPIQTGLVVGAALRRSRAAQKADRTKRGEPSGYHVRAHTRRGHWHHFWTGRKAVPEERKITLKWVAPMLVGGKDESDITTIHPVK